MKKEGKCRICGMIGPLTFEHIPPRGALNSSLSMLYSGEELIKRLYAGDVDPTKGLRYKTLQQGYGQHALCQKCNNNTGSFYAPHYNELAKAVVAKLKNEDFNSSIENREMNIKVRGMNGLAVFKQIISMFCSTSNTDLFIDEFKDFILDQKSTQFKRDRWSVHMYINAGSRIHGSSGVMASMYGKQTEVFPLVGAEVLTNPFGFVLIDQLTTSPQLQSLVHVIGGNITEMSTMPYCEQSVELNIPFRKKPFLMI